jgi:hypothetical protein
MVKYVTNTLPGLGPPPGKVRKGVISNMVTLISLLLAIAIVIAQACIYKALSSWSSPGSVDTGDYTAIAFV